jgi:hypothetical protein
MAPSGFGATLKDLYGKLDLTIALPPQSRSMFDTRSSKIDPALLTPGRSSPGARDLGGDATLAVIITLRNAADDATVRASVTAGGGRVTAASGRLLYCRIPAGLLQTLAGLTEVLDVAAQPQFHEPHLPSPSAGGASSRGLMEAGLAATHVSLLHQKGIKGRGVKLGILDFGFSGYNDLQARGKLPAPKAARGFGKDGAWDRGKTGTPHGAACAEIIHLMAPEADLYIAAVGDGSGSANGDEIQNAAHWLMDMNVDIISFSGGGHGGAHNGKAEDDDLVAEAARRGILWVVSAGNEGDTHWGKDVPPGNDKLVTTETKNFLLLVGVKDEELSVLLTWDDWGANPKDPHSD